MVRCKLRHNEVLREHIGPKSQGKVPFSSQTGSQLLCAIPSLHDEMAFDNPVPSFWSVGSRGEKRGPLGWTATVLQRPWDRASGITLSCEPSIFSLQQLSNVPHTSVPRQPQCTGLCMVCQGGDRSLSVLLPCGMDLLLTACDKAKTMRASLLCCFSCSENWDLISLLCVSFVTACWE